MSEIIYKLFIAILLLAVLPLQVIVALLALVVSGPPIIYMQKRVSKDGKQFNLYKFRTMQEGADRKQKFFTKLNEADWPVFKIRNDPRFTKIGIFLSHTGLDELPQLLNVLKGEMALIGPRPLPGAEEKKLKKWQKARERIKPGIISPWILEGYHAKSFDEWMKRDIEYIKQKSLLYDLGLSIKAVKFLLGLFIREITNG